MLIDLVDRMRPGSVAIIHSPEDKNPPGKSTDHIHFNDRSLCRFKTSSTVCCARRKVSNEAMINL